MTVDLEARALAGDARAQVEFAQRLDELGRHGEAVDWLARAGRADDVQALTLLGLRLLTGDNAPYLPADGARLLSDAASRGGAAAAGHLAVLIGGGIHAQQSWPVALDLLQRSAELGSASARTQLRILAGADEGDRPDRPEAWRELRQAVDMEAWTAPAPGVTLSQSPFVRSFQGLAPPAACEWVIGQSRGRLVRAELYDPDTGKPVLSTETRLNRIANFGLADTNLLNILVQTRISASLGIDFHHFESFAVLNYLVGEEYGEHVDYLDPAIPAYTAEIDQRGQRIGTCLIYLNADFEGGETEFPQLGIRNRPERAGDALMFVSAAGGKPDPRTVHAGRPVTSGEKWVLSQFIRDRPVIGVGTRTS